MRQSVMILLVFINGLIIGGAIAWILEDKLEPPPPPPANRYRLERVGNGQIGFFDRTTGKYLSFHQHESLWFIAIHDPVNGSVTYRETKRIEDPAFSNAVDQLKTELPERLGRLGRDL